MPDEEKLQLVDFLGFACSPVLLGETISHNWTVTYVVGDLFETWVAPFWCYFSVQGRTDKTYCSVGTREVEASTTLDIGDVSTRESVPLPFSTPLGPCPLAPYPDPPGETSDGKDSRETTGVSPHRSPRQDVDCRCGAAGDMRLPGGDSEWGEMSRIRARVGRGRGCEPVQGADLGRWGGGTWGRETGRQEDR